MDGVENGPRPAGQLPGPMAPAIASTAQALIDDMPFGNGSRTHPAAAPPRQVFRREGEYWTIAYDGIVCRLRDVQGLRLLARLLLSPGQRISALQLLDLVHGMRQETPAAATAPVDLTAGSPAAGNGRFAPCEPSGLSDGPAAERARVNVTRAIKAALQRIGAHHPTLRAHLSSTVRTGSTCVYLPDPRVPVAWEIVLVTTALAVNGWDEA